jgi:tRNA(fMet)-specific endonuclease VapC
VTYLLDSNAWIVLMRKQSATLSVKVHSANPADIALCSIVLGELLFGVHNSNPVKKSANLALVLQLQQQFRSVPFDDQAAEEYGMVRTDLKMRGLMIGSNDLLIASIALANHFTVVTHNTAEFGRINGLLIEDRQIP